MRQPASAGVFAEMDTLHRRICHISVAYRVRHPENSFGPHHIPGTEKRFTAGRQQKQFDLLIGKELPAGSKGEKPRSPLSGAAAQRFSPADLNFVRTECGAEKHTLHPMPGHHSLRTVRKPRRLRRRHSEAGDRPDGYSTSTEEPPPEHAGTTPFTSNHPISAG